MWILLSLCHGGSSLLPQQHAALAGTRLFWLCRVLAEAHGGGEDLRVSSYLLLGAVGLNKVLGELLRQVTHPHRYLTEHLLKSAGWA